MTPPIKSSFSDRKNVFFFFCQTSALRLPRKSAAGGERVVHASPPAAPPSKRTTPAEEERLEKTAAAELEVSHGGTFAGEASSEPAGGRKAGVNATTRMHVRVGLDGLEDADRGQEPTVWAMVGGSSANTGKIDARAGQKLM